MKNFFKTLCSKIQPNLALTFSCVIGLIIVATIFYPLIPDLLNYPPDSINNDFQITVNYFHYTVQYMAIISIIIIFSLIALPLLTKNINKINGSNLKNNSNNTSFFKTIKFCFNFPYKLLLFVLFFPPIILLLALLLLKQDTVFAIKVTFVIFSMTSLIALITYSISDKILKGYLAKINLTNKAYGIRVNIKNKLLIQFFPLLIFTIVFSFLILYSQLVTINGTALFNSYSENINAAFKMNKPTDMQDAINVLESVKLSSNEDSYFVLKDDKTTYYSSTELSEFFVEYAFEYETTHNGRTYDYYGTPIEGSFIRYNIDGEDYLFGIKYNVFTTNMLYSVLPLFLLLFIVNVIFIYYISSNLKNNIKIISTNLSLISTDKKNISDKNLSIISNDELSDLTIAFNSIQQLTASHIKQIHSNQELLMEKERLASLGQLIGGIAHNLKTPIMSISGATEGLHDLIKEYDTCIEDPEVNFNDHHEIAAEMQSWIKKIRTHTEYMSDVITAVKGQAVNFNNDQAFSFTISELLKRIDILMKHELKHSQTFLNIGMHVDENVSIDGDINSLIQVINNMISNSIQAYGDKKEQSIDLDVRSEGKNIIISIKDSGCGLPDKVKDKLFKEMVTTKGKNGTGLGLYMSYSTIKANFNGDILAESEKNKGTTFTIILPANLK